MIIETETADDRAAIWRIHAAAFSSRAEADLVDRLRADGDLVLSFVGIEGGQLVGHVAFSKMQAPFRALGMAPVAVEASFRRQGIAARLIEAGLSAARGDGWEVVFVLGNPDYYGRFGFRAAAAAPFESPYAGPHFMALALQSGPLPAPNGVVSYAPAFSALDEAQHS
jgi:putative acetyltransferase